LLLSIVESSRARMRRRVVASVHVASESRNQSREDAP
jgi:hypothetical protein